jgi:glucokinase
VIAVGVDLGGSNLRVAAFRDADASPICQHKEAVGEPRDPDTIVERLAAAIGAIAAQAGAAADEEVPVGVGIAAMLRDRHGNVANSPHLRWRDVDFGARLAARLGNRHPLGVYNDVNAIAYGEFGLGAGAGAHDMLAVFVGTGIGGGLVVDGRLAEGSTSCAGEIGHTKVRWDDDAMPCACGQRGCVEAYCGGAFLQRRIRAELAAGASPSTVALAGRADVATAGHVDDAAAAGDPWALALWAELAPLLGVTLANAVALLNPDRLVIGGGVLSRTPLFREQVLAALAVACPVALFEPLTVVDAALGDDAGLVGAALLARRGYCAASRSLSAPV